MNQVPNIPQKSHLKILRRCGFVLTFVGILDILYAIWCIANRVSYSSSLNIFALIGGILLMRGGLKTARWIAIISTFLLATVITGIVVLPFSQPLGYWIAVIKHGSGIWFSFIVLALLVALFVWVRRQLMSVEVRLAQTEAGIPATRTKVPLILGIALPLIAITFVGVLKKGDDSKEAIKRAKQELGSGYQYTVTNIQIQYANSTKSVQAIVAAYNEAEIKNIEISWSE